MTALPIDALVSCAEPSESLKELNADVLPKAVQRLNAHALPNRMRVFDTDPLPTNQRNLTDFRTRVGNLLEWELANALRDELLIESQGEWRLMNIVANRFPDLEFRSLRGQRGLRLEIKAVDVTAEEKAANFDTLIKDIRAGQDYVVVLVWKWKRDLTTASRFPFVICAVALEASVLAKIRDSSWLSQPPPSTRKARQGFDIRFAVNCSGDNYNQEEGNLGKLMRLAEASDRPHLLPAACGTDTFREYLGLKDRIIIEGLREMADILGVAWGGALEGASVANASFRAIYEKAGARIVINGSASMPAYAAAVRCAKDVANCVAVVLLNGKFAWRVYRPTGERLGDGQKPGEAKTLLENL
jgi:hypothetical protein